MNQPSDWARNADVGDFKAALSTVTMIVLLVVIAAAAS
jgi:hypothetical protein